jgi:general secretion pathway protein C
LLLQNGDRLLTINGLDLSSPDKALETYVRLRAANHLVVALERRGAPITLDYTIR